MMMRSLAVLFLLLVLLSVQTTLSQPVPVAPESALAARIDAVIRAPRFASSRWGILVVDPDSGRTVFAHHADQLFAPASVTKLYSCAAALVTLGPDSCFETPVHRRGTLKGDRLEGDLILVARGDLTLGGRTAPDGRMAFANEDHIYANAGKLTTGLTDPDPLAGLKELARQVRASGIRQV
ncbi:MAG: D-alanyl-D-alanine carboxypeptidase, partial [Gemmataceae bacterium]